MGEVDKISFDVLDLPLIVLNRVEADVPITLLHPPCSRHEAAFTDFHGALTIHLDNPLSLSLLLIFSGLFPLILMGRRA